MKINKLVEWLQINHPQWVIQMKSSDHHLSNKVLNPTHLESDVWTHLCMVLLVAEKLDISFPAKVAALLHDIGKPATRKVKANDRVAFPHHESVSAFMALGAMEELSKISPLSEEEKVCIFLAISNHIEFHKLLKKCNIEGHLFPFVEKYKGMPETAKIIMELGIADSMGRFSSDEMPKDLAIWDLMKEAKDQEIFLNMERYKAQADRPSIDVLIGLPCSGKSTYRSNIKDKTIICRDDIMMAHNKKNSSYHEAYLSVDATKVNTELSILVKETIRKQENIVLDMTNLSLTKRQISLNHCQHYHKRAILFLETMDIIEERNKERAKKENKHIPSNLLLEMMADFDAPNYNEFDEIIVYYKGKEVALK